MKIDKAYIRNDSLRAAAESIADKYPKYAPEIFKKRLLSFHDASGASYNREEVPHFALVSELTYWIAKDGRFSTAATWWDICDALGCYWLYNITTGNTYSTTTAQAVREMGKQFGIEPSCIDAACSTLMAHVKDIQFGAYLANPSALLSASKSKFSGAALLLGGAALAGLGFVATKSKK